MVGFAVLMIQVLGAALGATTAGFIIDFLAAAGVAEPYSMTLVTYAFISLLAVPIFIYAGRRFERDLKAIRRI